MFTCLQTWMFYIQSLKESDPHSCKDWIKSNLCFHPRMRGRKFCARLLSHLGRKKDYTIFVSWFGDRTIIGLKTCQNLKPMDTHGMSVLFFCCLAVLLMLDSRGSILPPLGAHGAERCGLACKRPASTHLSASHKALFFLSCITCITVTFWSHSSWSSSHLFPCSTLLFRVTTWLSH